MNKSTVKRIQFFKGVLISAVFASAFASGKSLDLINNPTLTEEDVRIVDDFKKLSKNENGEFDLSEFQKNSDLMEKSYEEAKMFAESLKSSNRTMREMSEKSQQKEDFSSKNIVLFASRSLGKRGLKNIFETASHNQNVLVVFRGIPKDANLGEAMLEIQDIAVQYNPVPNIIIDPALFEEYKVEVVPAVVIREESTTGFNKLPKEVAKVFGLSTYDWIMSQIESGGRGDLGVRGPVADISEPNLIELMKERFAAIDWEEKKEAAKNNFWKNQKFRTLPKATKARTRFIDPSIYITADIKAENGAIIASKGDVINPLDITPFTQAVIVFDPLDKGQVKLVRNSLERISKTEGVTKITYIATRFDKEKGWDSYKEATDAFSAPVYLLTPDFQSRFQLERVPSVITAKGREFSIEELHVQSEVETEVNDHE